MNSVSQRDTDLGSLFTLNADLDGGRRSSAVFFASRSFGKAKIATIAAAAPKTNDLRELLELTGGTLVV
ncbi:MAG: hypothetical protein AAGB46_01830 [Verrucomicrobiota bacterium]